MQSVLRQSKNFKFSGHAGQTWILNQGFHTTPKRQVPPIVLALIKPMARFGAMFIGR